MSTSREALTAILEAATGVTTLSSTRIYPGRAPQNVAHPYVIHWKISHPRNHAFGTDVAASGARHQVRFVGKTLTATEALALACKTAISRYRGTATGVVVQDILLENEWDPEYDAETGEYMIDQDYIIWHEE